MGSHSSDSSDDEHKHKHGKKHKKEKKHKHHNEGGHYGGGHSQAHYLPPPFQHAHGSHSPGPHIPGLVGPQSHGSHSPTHSYPVFAPPEHHNHQQHQHHYEQPVYHDRGHGGEPLPHMSPPHMSSPHMSSPHMPAPHMPFAHHEESHEAHKGHYQTPPPSGYRVALTANVPFPPIHQTGPPPFYDADGASPVFVGSAIMENSVHPCKICPALFPSCRVPYGSSEYSHHGRYDLLPITPDMEWVRTREGEIPIGRRPVEGGYEENGEKLYHAVALINGIEVPGKAGHHLGGATIAFGGHERMVHHDYKILCWR